MKLFTIGFTQKSAEEFFTALQQAGVRRVVDVRLNNTSQLAGFSKRDDLQYFLRATGKIEYLHLPDLAPTQAILDAFKKHKGSWEEYAPQFLALLAERRVVTTLDRAQFEHACLLCSEATPEHCHRRLVAEMLAASWPGLEIIHL